MHLQEGNMKISAMFTRIQIMLHWATAFLVIPIWVLHDGMVNTSRALRNGETPSASDSLIAQFHVWGGIAVFLFVLWRLYVRFTHGAPAAPANENAFLKFVASATQVLLYGLLIYLSITGMLIYFLDIRQAGELHELAKLPILLLIGLHTAGALYHHFILKTDVLTRMFKAQ
jgi:cytochrome b561